MATLSSKPLIQYMIFFCVSTFLLFSPLAYAQARVMAIHNKTQSHVLMTITRTHCLAQGINLHPVTLVPNAHRAHRVIIRPMEGTIGRGVCQGGADVDIKMETQDGRILTARFYMRRPEANPPNWFRVTPGGIGYSTNGNTLTLK